MALEFVGKDPDSLQGESPTVWVDNASSELAILGWIADQATVEECLKYGAIRDDEVVVRIPLRMAAFLREALNKLEGPDAQGGGSSRDAGD